MGLTAVLWYRMLERCIAALFFLRFSPDRRREWVTGAGDMTAADRPGLGVNGDLRTKDDFR